ncbi:hypothetical protein BDV18DRAFT_144692 [Aspergillus unguis]
MRFFAITALLATTALAMPGNLYPNGGNPGTGVEPTNPGNDGNTGGNNGNGGNGDNSQAGQTCGAAQLSCCKSNGDFNNSPDNTASASGLAGLLGLGNVLTGALDGLLGGYAACNVLSGVDSCNEETVCCNPSDTPQFGLVNVNIPCIPINAL